MQPVTKAILAARATQVFDASAGWPTEVRQPLLAPVVTNQVIIDAIVVCDDLCNKLCPRSPESRSSPGYAMQARWERPVTPTARAHAPPTDSPRDGKTLSQAFGNFDRRVALGWLLADAAGMPLLDRPQAHALGIKAQRADGAAKAPIREARKKAIGPARVAGADISRAQDDAEAAVLRTDAKVVALQQPPANAHAVSERAGSRKRAREPEPSHNDEVQTLEARLLQADKQVSKAETKLEKAEAASDEASMGKFKRLAARTDEHASMSAKLSQEHARKVLRV